LVKALTYLERDQVKYSINQLKNEIEVETRQKDWKYVGKNSRKRSVIIIYLFLVLASLFFLAYFPFFPYLILRYGNNLCCEAGFKAGFYYV